MLDKHLTHSVSSSKLVPEAVSHDGPRGQAACFQNGRPYPTGLRPRKKSNVPWFQTRPFGYLPFGVGSCRYLVPEPANAATFLSLTFVSRFLSLFWPASSHPSVPTGRRSKSRPASSRGSRTSRP